MDQAVYVLVTFIVLASILTLLIVIHSFLEEPKFIDFEPDLLKLLQYYLQQENKLKYDKLGMKWIIPDERCYWLELHVLSK